MAQRLQDMAADMLLWNATIAHELRTPLTILKGKLQGIIDGVFQPDEKLLQGLVLQVDSLARLVEDLRVITLADSSHLDLRIAPVRLAGEIEKVAMMLEHEMKVEGFALKLDLANITTPADAARLRQVVLALLTNARRYAVRGTIEVSLREENSRAILRVEDEGPGVATEIAARVFEPFVRVQSDLREVGGNGLGLSVVRAIVEAHGGQIRCLSSRKGGAMFEIALQLQR